MNFFIIFEVLGIEPMDSHMLGKCSTVELCSQANVFLKIVFWSKIQWYIPVDPDTWDTEAGGPMETTVGV